MAPLTITVVFEAQPELAPLFLALHRVLTRSQRYDERTLADDDRDKLLAALPAAFAALAPAVEAALDWDWRTWHPDERTALRIFCRRLDLFKERQSASGDLVTWQATFWEKFESVFPQKNPAQATIDSRVNNALAYGWYDPENPTFHHRGEPAEPLLDFDDWAREVVDGVIPAEWFWMIRNFSVAMYARLIDKLRAYLRAQAEKSDTVAHNPKEDTQEERQGIQQTKQEI